MDITIQPGLLQGTLSAIPSKSYAHRILICASLADSPTDVACGPVGADVTATIQCLKALGAGIIKNGHGYRVSPIQTPAKQAVLPCGESGSTLRFLLPLVGALGVDATFQTSGRLGQRPLSPLWEAMEENGCQLSRPTVDTIRCCGKLQPGIYDLSGSASSQFFSGLMIALPLLQGESKLYCHQIASLPYIHITTDVLHNFSIVTDVIGNISNKCYLSPTALTVEGDWSNAAFFLASNALGSHVHITGLNPESAQGDRMVVSLLSQMEKPIRISCEDIPDLIPILSVVAACKKGAVFTDIQRLRLKESDRVASILDMIRSLGGKAEATENTLTISPHPFYGGTVNSHNDHRIAMAAAIAATVCKAPVTLLGAEATNKSYPGFWEDFRTLGGKI